MIIWIAPVLLWLTDRADDYLDFLRSIPSLIAPKPTPQAGSYTPPFIGGQCADVYNVSVDYFSTKMQGTEQQNGTLTLTLRGAIVGVGFEQIGQNSNGKIYQWFISAQGGSQKQQVTTVGDFGTNLIVSGRIIITSITRQDGALSDSCGNVPNQTPSPPIPDDGLFAPQNPLIADDNGTINPAAIVLVPAIPLVLVPLISSAIAAALSAAKAATDALEAAKKIAEALEELIDLWKLLKEFLDDWKKNRPKNRDIVRQTYGQILGDGALDFFPNNNTKFKAIQLDVIITAIPIGFGKFFGSLSPSRYRYKELGYIAFYSVNQGILEVHPIQFKRTSYQIPELAVGFIYHLGLNNQIRGYAFGSFSVEKT